MKSRFLFPYSLKKGSAILFVTSFLVYLFISLYNGEQEILELNVKVFGLIYDKGMHTEYLSFTNNDIIDELLACIFIVSGLVFAFSKEKIEDELVTKIRLESLVWATYVNYAILLICIIFIYGLSFLQVMQYNMFTLLLFFIVRFRWILYKNSKLASYDE